MELMIQNIQYILSWGTQQINKYNRNDLRINNQNI
jgi:hypothetical protein